MWYYIVFHYDSWYYNACKCIHEGFCFPQASHEGTTTAGVAHDLPAHVSATAAAAVVVVRPPLISHSAVTH